MIEVRLAGRWLMPHEYGLPSNLRSAFRGPEAASREPGSANFTVYVDTERESTEVTKSALVKGSEVLIRVGGRDWFRGQITGFPNVDQILPKVQVECTEDAGILADLMCGMKTIAGIENPLLYVWTGEGSHTNIGDDPHGDPVVVAPFLIRFGGYYTDEAQAATHGFAKTNLMDSYRYKRSASPDSKVRSLAMGEEPIAVIARKCVDLCQMLNGPQVSQVVANVGGGPQVSIMVRTSDDEVLRAAPFPNGDLQPYGLETRSFKSASASFFWRMVEDSDGRGGQIEVYQLINHSVAQRLGRFSAIAPDTFNVFNVAPDSWLDFRDRLEFGHFGGEAIHHIDGRGIYGPFAVPRQIGTDGPRLPETRLAWYYISSQPIYVAAEEKWYYWRRAVVYDIDLEQVLDTDREKLLPRRNELEAYTLTGPTYDYVEPSAEGTYYVLSNNPSRLTSTRSLRDGGRYELSRATGALGPVFWIGDLWLSECAYEFSNKSLVDVMRNVSLACGSEWWIDPDGTLYVQNVERSRETIQVDAVSVFQNYFVDGKSDRQFESYSIEGLPLGEIYTLKQKIEWQRISKRINSRRRVLTIEPTDWNLKLGQTAVTKAGSGRVAARETTDGIKLTLELESL